MTAVPAPALSRHVALVTGASGAIGGAIVEALAQAGATVHGVGRDPEKLATLGRRATTAAGAVHTHQVDLTRDAEIATLVTRVSESSGRLDVLVHSSGRISYGTLRDTPVERLDELYHVNLRAPYLLTQLCLPALTKVHGQIVFINSSTGLAARAGIGQYSAIKHAFKALADALRDEVNADGIRVLSVYPGRTASQLTLERYALEGRVYEPELLLQPEDVASIVISSLSLPRTAEVTNVSIRPLKKSY
jgi:NADP-dependent 3-hydroxy acid dehydrogenase YdfG